MLRALIFIFVGMLPLSAQTSLDQSNKMAPPTPVNVSPATPPNAETIAPGLAGPSMVPPLTNSDIPAPPPVMPAPVELTVSPGTVREGLTYSEAIKTTVTLSEPAVKELVCHVMSSDPKRMTCGDITFEKGAQQGDGAIEINWTNVHHNCQLAIKAFVDTDPETILQARIYLRKKIE